VRVQPQEKRIPRPKSAHSQDRHGEDRQRYLRAVEVGETNEQHPVEYPKNRHHDEAENDFLRQHDLVVNRKSQWSLEGLLVSGTPQIKKIKYSSNPTHVVSADFDFGPSQGLLASAFRIYSREDANRKVQEQIGNPNEQQEQQQMYNVIDQLQSRKHRIGVDIVVVQMLASKSGNLVVLQAQLAQFSVFEDRRRR